MSDSCHRRAEGGQAATPAVCTLAAGAAERDVADPDATLLNQAVDPGLQPWTDQ